MRKISIFIAAMVSAAWMGHRLQGAPLNLAQTPLIVSTDVPPLVMLTMGRNHKLYYEAYNDASDLNGDGILDVGYKPQDIDYYGYFDSHKCYSYDNGSKRFVPVATTADKKCNGQWSGDFLNYLTTSRMDALRKVLYGGYRAIDGADLTVLQRAYIPQDAHSWGKEYKDVATDGYDISDYTPLSPPAPGMRHLFANTTLSDNGPPLLRVLTNSPYRIWEWVSIERPVAGNECATGNNQRRPCTSGGEWSIVPPEAFQNLIQSTYDISRSRDHYPDNHQEYNILVKKFAKKKYRFGRGPANQINGSGNPFGRDDQYLTLFKGELQIPTTGTYEFAVDGDDAVELIIDGHVVAAWYGGHGKCNCQNHHGSIFLSQGTHTIQFRHQEWGGGDNYYLYWKPPSSATSTLTDYEVRIVVCKAGLLEDNCEEYPNGNYKPIGLLQKYGASGLMKFGLITGSYAKNTSGGVLRKNIESLADEIDPNTGQMTASVGILKTLDRLRIVGFGYPPIANYYYYQNCGWITTRPIREGECRMWGNPVAEMMYEALRYFAGKASPTSNFMIATSGNDDAQLGLPLASWEDPYAQGKNEWCAKPFQLVISDINPSYDTDQVPGSFFEAFSGDISGLNVSSLANTITAHEPDVTGLHYIGQSGSNYDGAPTPKSVSSLATIRGLAPEEPTKQGGYYAASIAYFGLTHDINPVDGGNEDKGQKVQTFSVALASPLPKIEIPVSGKSITLVPFAKTVGGCLGANQSSFKPTNTIVDFYVENLTPTSGKFRINFEDVEQGADHDMDAIVTYSYIVNGDNTVTVSLSSDYAAGCLIQHLGYVISGTSADGIYLEVRDKDTAASVDPDYFLDTPPGQLPGGGWNDGQALPLQTTRTFTPGRGSTATLLKDPLWYAAKWGGFLDRNGNDLPDQANEWDTDGNGTPDNYFLVTNALTLEQQLIKAFKGIIGRLGSAASGATNTAVLKSQSRFYQVRFNSGHWSGQILSFPVKDDGTLDTSGPGPDGAEWDAGEKLSQQNWDTGRNIITFNPTAKDGVPFRWDSLDASQQAFLHLNPDEGTPDGKGEMRLRYLRGDSENEGTGPGQYRQRTSKLGDIVNSNPALVAEPSARYPDASYLSFVQDNHDRTPIIYVGANDGMLHGFDADSGEEKLAYVPNEVFDKLSLLTSPNYNHRYYVDGSPTTVDAFIQGEWRTILVGSLNAGGQGYFALDVTDPAGFSESAASDIVLWEFTDKDDPDLGYSFSQPAIVKMHNGKWAAIFGNGYNNTEPDDAGGCSDDIPQTPCTVSATGHAVLYILFIEEGTDGQWSTSDFIKLDTQTGDAVTPNGLATPAPVDVDGDYMVDYIYVGDLQGNLWKFDVTASNPNRWGVMKQGNTPKPLFKATDADGHPQPITSRPEVSLHPTGQGYLVLFGTGKFLEDGDKADTSIQSFYAIWDKNDGTQVSRQDLLEQTVLEVHNKLGADFRVTSDQAIQWRNESGQGYLGWYMDLPTSGERVVSNPILFIDRVVFTTLIPSQEACASGGTSWLMELDIDNGGRPDTPFFDINNDNIFDETDMVQVDFDVTGDNQVNTEDIASPTGRKSQVGIIPEPTMLLGLSKKVLYKYTSGSSGGVEMVSNRASEAGRQSWKELK